MHNPVTSIDITTPPFQIVQLDHLVLRCCELQQMRQFYVQTLGCTLEREVPELGLCQLRSGSQLIDLISVNGPLGQTGGAAPTASGHNMAHFCLLIQPYHPQQLMDYFQQRAIEVSASEVRYGAQGFGPSLYIKDPMGNTVELKALQTNAQ